MLSHKKVIGMDGKTILWTRLKTYQGTAVQVIRTTMKCLEKFHETLKNGLKYNIKKFEIIGLSH